MFSGGSQLPGPVIVGAIWNIRSSYPFSAKAGVDLNGAGANTDYVPGTTKNMGNRKTAEMMAAVNAYRATLRLAPIPESQIDSVSVIMTNVWRKTVCRKLLDWIQGCE